MNRRNLILSGWRAVALAAVAAGCTPLTGSRIDPGAGKSTHTSFDTGTGGPGGVVPAAYAQTADAFGPVDLAGGQPVGAFQGQPVATPGQPLGAPRPAPPAPLNMGSAPGYPVGAPGGDPQRLAQPTWGGGRLDLRPGEVPTDKVLELTRQIELVLGQNRELAARITELERQGAGREQALVEALREVEAAEAEVSKARGVITTQAADLKRLQDRIQQIEKEDIELLRLVIDALSKTLPPAGRKP